MTSAVAQTAKAFTITHCRHCGGQELTWATSIVNRSDVQQGRLTTRDVECMFYLGCDTCSETLAMFSADRLADVVNARMVEPRAAAEAQQEAACQGIPGTSFQRLNALANQGE